MSEILHSRHHDTTSVKPSIMPQPEAEQIGAICQPTFRPNLQVYQQFQRHPKGIR